MRILLVERDRRVAGFLEAGLRAEAFAVDALVCVSEDQLLARAGGYDLVILDPAAYTGRVFEFLRRIQTDENPPPLSLALVGHRMQDRVRALDRGADDCISRPVTLTELCAHVRAVLRRRGYPVERVLRVADLELDLASRTVTRGGRRMDLTQREFSLLLCLMRSAGRVVTREAILDRVWNVSFGTSTNVAEVYVNYLRGKVDVGFEDKLIHTVRGAGYILAAPQPFPRVARGGERGRRGTERSRS